MAGFKEYQMLFQLNASMGGGFQAAFSAGASSVTQLQEKINSLNRTQSDIASYQKQQTAIEKTKAKIDLYTTQLHNLQSATATTSKEEAELANAIAAKEKQLNDSNNKLAEQNAALSETGQALREAGVDTENLATESERLKAESAAVAQAQKEEAEAAKEAGQSLKEAMTGAAAALEAAGIISGLKQIYSALEDCSQVAAEFETAMAGVKRTVGGDDAFISGLGEDFKELSTQIPITATELASIATTAGQLGIAQDNVETFTTVMAQLGTTTDLTADSAATMLAQFANITGVTDYERLGSTVAALGDSTATTASKVVDMSQGMAAAASVAGMSSTDILAVSAAVGSLGIEAASGSTAMSQLITTLYKATETGDQLEEIAAVAGMTAQEFKTAWAQDAVSAMDAFVQGLNNVEQNGASAIVVLDQLGINNVRQTKAILGLASAGGLLSNTINVANSAWNENTALTEKASVMYNTTEARLQMMGNAANNVKIAIGDALNPAISSVTDAITSLLQPISEWIEANPAIVQGLTAAVAVLGIATAGVLAYSAATKLAAAASALFSASIPGLGVILGVAAAIGGIVTAVSALTSANQEAAKSFAEMDAEYDGLIQQLDEQTAVIDLVENYRKLSNQTTNLQTLMKKGFKVNVQASDKKVTTDDLLDVDETVTFTGEPGNTLTKEDFGISDQTLIYLASMDETSYEEVKAKATTLKEELSKSTTELNTAKIELAKAQDLALALQQKIAGEENKDKKSALQTQLEEVNATITEQETKVTELQRKHDQLSSEYGVVSTAAAELKGKEEELVAIKQQLAGVVPDVTAASEGQANAYNAEADAAERAAKARRDELQNALYASIIEQSGAYVQSLNDEEAATESRNKAQEKLAQMRAQVSDNTKGDSDAIRAQLTEVDRLYSEWANIDGMMTEMPEELSKGASALQDMVEAATGYRPTIESIIGAGSTWIDQIVNGSGEIKESIVDVQKEVEGYQSQIDSADSVQQEFINNLVNGVQNGVMKTDELRSALEETFSETENGATIVDQVMEEVEAQLDAAAAAAEDYAAATEEMSVSEGRSVDDIIADLKNLQSAYEEAYSSAYSSMSGQFSLFEDASAKIEQMRKGYEGGTQGMTSGIDSQQAYIEEYTNNFTLAQQKLAEAGVSAETAQTILASLSDGSAESGAMLQSIAEGSTESAKSLAASYEGLEEAKAKYAQIVAETETDFSSKMAKLASELEETIAGMDKSSEAASAAKETLEAYVNAADGYVSIASTKYGAVAAAAVAALKASFSSLGIPGFAKGTKNAPEGMALVGEKGPELVYFNGGETVIPADKTAQMAKAVDAEAVEAATKSIVNNGSNYSMQFSPSINVESGVTADQVKNVIQEQTVNLRDQMEDMLAEITQDENRRKLR